MADRRLGWAVRRVESKIGIHQPAVRGARADEVIE